MKALLAAFALPAVAFQPLARAAAFPMPKEPIRFAWRESKGDFPQDKPGYLVLTTEDAVTWSRMLPEFVKQKQAMGFHVYVATEKDYGTGKTGNAQAAQVRAWLRDFQKRTGARYALLIGNSNPNSADLPSPTIPDGEHGGMEASYCDLDGKWVDIYLNTTEKDTRSGWQQMCAGSILLPKAIKEGGPRVDELITSRISYCGSEIGNSAYDLDRILDKTIRYERDTVAGKDLDWRARAFSVTSNYGGANWDMGLVKAAETAGGSVEIHSALGLFDRYVPENYFDGQTVNAGLMTQARRRGMACTCSHGWNRGGEGITTQWDIFRNMDDRWPSTVGVAACTAFALADTCNMGQSWIRKGGIFACGTGWSGNNGCRIRMQTNLLEKRGSVGEAVHNAVVQYGDPSLHVLPPAGKPACSLRVSPAFTGHYEELTLGSGPVRPVSLTYTLTNRSETPIGLTSSCDSTWLDLSPATLTLQPGESADIRATSNDRLPKLAPGVHLSNIRFRRDDGQTDDRRFAVNLQPVHLAAAYSFDSLDENNRFPDLSLEPGFNRSIQSFWLVEKQVRWRNQKITPGAKIPGFDPEPKGKVGGALRLDGTPKPWSRAIPGFTRWRGISVSLWLMVNALPEAKKTTAILTSPFSLTLASDGTLNFAQNGKPATLGSINPGEWHFIQFRSHTGTQQSRASLDGQPETTIAAGAPPAANLTLGTFAGTVDEIRVWSGELDDAAVAREFASAAAPFQLPAAPPPGGYLSDGVVRPPADLPAAFDMADASATLDLSKILAAANLGCDLREAPGWLDFKNGILSLKSGVAFDDLDFGGYDLILVLKSRAGDLAGRTCEVPLKVRIPVPAVNIRLQRAKDGRISFTNAGDRFGPATRPLAPGVIRYTTDGSPVTLESPVYTTPFQPREGMRITARFFLYGDYPMAPVSSNTEFGVSHEKWSALAVSGDTLPQAPNALDGDPATAWKNSGGTLPQFLAWDMGAPTALTSISCHSTIRDQTGRVKDYILHASDDGMTWRKIAEGQFGNTPNASRVRLKTSLTTRFLKLEILTVHDGKDAVITDLECFAN